MKTYEEYKESGVLGVNEVPEKWKVVNFRYLIDILTDFTSNGSFADLAKNVNYLEEGISRLVRLTDLRANFQNKGIYLNESSHNYLKKSELFGGEILLANVGAYAGLAWVFENFEGEASLGPNMFLLKFKEVLDKRFAYFSLTSFYLHSQLLDKATSSAQPKLNKEDIRTCNFVLPSLKEQTQIAKYLDHKTEIIDALIAKKELLVKKLELQRQAIINEPVTKGLNKNAKMKDSGIEWLGEIPEHWEVVKLKFLVSDKLKYGANESAEDENKNDPRYIRITDFGNDGKLKKNTFKSLTFEKAEQYLLEDGDILFARSGATVGKTFQFKNYNGLACFAGYLIKASVNDKILSDYLYYYTKSNIYENWKDSIFIQATIQNISAEKYNNLEIPIPNNIQEQSVIVEKIRGKAFIIDNLINKSFNQIKKLKSYRQSIISEAVTGKIDVRDWQAPKK